MNGVVSMPHYSDLTLPDLLDAFSSNAPVPGGGSAAALAGALGASLLVMAASLPRTRSGAPEETADLAEAAARLRPLRDHLMVCVDGDSEAYEEVIAARRLPRESEAERAARQDAIVAATWRAVAVPLETMAACRAALSESVIVARNAARVAGSDVGVAVELLLVGVRGSGLNVDANLPALDEEEGVAARRAERQRLEAESAGDAERARAAIASADDRGRAESSSA